MKQKSQ